jgi:hypothetical protein
LARALPGRRYATAMERAYWLIVSAGAAQREEVKRFAQWLRAEAARAAPRARRR